MSGNNRSHSLRATRREWNVNLQWATIDVNGQKVRVRVSTKTLKTLRKGQKKASQAPVAEEKKVEATPAPVAAPAAAPVAPATEASK